MKKAVIFAGPSLSGDPVLQDTAFAWRPPAGEGDVYRAARSRPPAIGLIDGTFESGPAVWHKEILWALSQGIPVYGAASMGALRAAELAPFGMVGVGKIAAQFLSGALEDDDEVAIVHAPAELGYRPLSDAMVDIRATLEAAAADGVLSCKAAQTLTAFAKALFFKERHWQALLAHKALGAKRATFGHWLAQNKVEQKRRDALALVAALRKPVKAPRTAFAFQKTVHWQQLVARHG